MQHHPVQQCPPQQGPPMGQPPSLCPPPMVDSFYNPQSYPPFQRTNHSNYYPSPDFRIYELNRKLQQRTDACDSIWWDAFVTEFFEDDATISLTGPLEEGHKQFTIGRTLIPRYFRSFFEGHVTDLSFHLRRAKESIHQSSITLDCEECLIITHYDSQVMDKTRNSGQYPPYSDPNQKKDLQTKDNSLIVQTEGRLILEFPFNEPMRIRRWNFTTRGYRELIARSYLANSAQQDPVKMLEQLKGDVSKHGLTKSLLLYLKLGALLEPMQELMVAYKSYLTSPRDCLKTTLYNRWQKTVTPQDNQKAPSKRRKRKTPANMANSGNGPAGGSNVASCGGPGGKKKNNGNNSNMSPGPSNFGQMM